MVSNWKKRLFETFFSTIAYYLEDKKWGSKYSYVMKKLYSGELSFKNVDNAINELKNIRDFLEKLDKEHNKIIWDARDLIEIFLFALNDSKESNNNLLLTSLTKNTSSYF